jgi:hypothetical protein
VRKEGLVEWGIGRVVEWSSGRVGNWSSGSVGEWESGRVGAAFSRENRCRRSEVGARIDDCRFMIDD